MTASTADVLEISDVSIAFGGVVAVDHVSLRVKAGEILAVIGPNGAGKTTLFNIISGLYRPSSGTLRMRGQDVSGLAPTARAQKGLARTFQNLQVFSGMTAIENVMVGRARWESTGLLSDLFGLPASRRQTASSRARAADLLAQFGLTPYADVPAGKLSYGLLKRLEIARALATEPVLLLLDEPAAGCNAVETAEIVGIVRQIAQGPRAVVLIEHDMKMVMGLSDRVLVLQQGKVLSEGTPAQVRADPAVVEAYLGTHASEAEHAAA